MNVVGYMDRTASAVDHCESVANENSGVIADAYRKLAEFLQAKLWHQLTIQVLDILSKPAVYAAAQLPNDYTSGTHSFLALYDKVVLPVDVKLNPLSLAQMAALTSQAILAQDATAAKALLENFLAKQKESLEKAAVESSSSSSSNNNFKMLNQAFSVPATIFVESKLASLILATSPPTATSKDDFVDVWRKLQANQDRLHEFPSEGQSELAAVHAAHFEAAMSYYKRLGPPEAFYEQALNYLQHKGPDFGVVSSSDDRPTAIDDDARTLAVDLITAALTGDGVYNLGQVEQTPVLRLLSETPDHAWLVNLLQATAAGDVVLFRKYQQDYASQMAQQTPALVHRAAAVKEKLTLLALVSLIFSKPSHERLLTFEEIAQALRLGDEEGVEDGGINQVEWIVMRALSVHLMEGSIDQVAQTVEVTWVLPRVLNPAQMQELAARFGEWAAKVSTTQESVAHSSQALA